MKKNIIILFTLLVTISILSACQSPYKKRKRCKGNGSWYGNRNLGSNDKIKNTDDIFVFNFLSIDIKN